MKKFTKKIIFIFAFVVLSLLISSCAGEESLNSISKKISTYEMQIEYLEDNTLNVVQTFNYVNCTDTVLNKVYFHLYPKAFSKGAVNKPVGVLSKEKAYPNGESYGDIEIKTVKNQSKEAYIYYEGEDSDILVVEMATSLAPDEKTNFFFEYKVVLPNINHRFGYGNNTINIANFYPVVAVYDDGNFTLDGYHHNGDPFYTDMANYYIEISAPTKYKIATTGEIKSSKNIDDISTYKVEAKVVRDFAFVLSEKFEEISTQLDGVEIKYYYYEDSDPAKYLQTAVDSIVTFNEIFGEYPYNTLSVVKCNFVHGGMEFPNLVYISDQIENTADYINVIVHEIAHQWWYQLVGSNAYKYPWLDEGLTEYSTLLFYEKNPSYNVKVDEVIENTLKSYSTFVELYTSVLGSLDTSMNRSLNEYNTEPEYVYITYVKGMLFFDNLREVVGDKRFFKSLQEYLKTYRYKNVKPEHMIGIFEKVCGTDLNSFFESWVEGKVNIISKK